MKEPLRAEHQLAAANSSFAIRSRMFAEHAPRMKRKMATGSKHTYFLNHREEALEAFENDTACFSDGSVLLWELRKVFDWIAGEHNAKLIAKKTFVSRLPEVHRKFPQLCGAFNRMDSKLDAWLDWEEFCSFCLKDELLKHTISGCTSLAIYGIDMQGRSTYKDTSDLAHTNDLGNSTNIMPWENSHLVTWRIDNLVVSSKGRRVRYGTDGGIEVVPGKAIASPVFQAAGLSGFLRFWPAGYWTESQRKRKAAEPPWDVKGPFPEPAPQAWCCLGACFEVGTDITFRYFVDTDQSAVRRCYFNSGTSPKRLFAPLAYEPPESLVETKSIIVGIEIFRNNRLPETVSKEHMTPKIREVHRPTLPEPPGPHGSVLLRRPQQQRLADIPRRPSLGSLLALSGTGSSAFKSSSAIRLPPPSLMALLDPLPEIGTPPRSREGASPPPPLQQSTRLRSCLKTSTSLPTLPSRNPPSPQPQLRERRMSEVMISDQEEYALL
eukprot:TRINITY_DN13451_c0_g2_i1.p1 TRINITY_DN13451_c0_g2~~TRINITY_DN13451_c0_g2_i1.p1  ORF type:complete len:494 (+),score=99.69 TRINITY_DN13451_c0_g2_i1:162-1643(+)